MKMLLVLSAISALVVHTTEPASAQSAADGTIATPPPVSGRSLATPTAITAADVLARIRLVHANLNSIREYMGVAQPPAPLLEASNVTIAEGYFATLNLKRRGLQLAFEALRVEKRWEGDIPTAPSAADAFAVTNELLVTTLQVKASLGIKTAIAEKAEKDATTMSDVFNQILKTGALLNAVLETKTKPEDIFYMVTLATHQAMGLHRKYTTELMPDEPAFEGGKTSEDVMSELEKSYGLVRELGTSLGLSMLAYKRVGSDREATSDDVSELIILVVSALERVRSAAGLKPYRSDFGLFGRRFPAHVYQRGRMLRTILRETLETYKKRK